MVAEPKVNWTLALRTVMNEYNGDTITIEEFEQRLDEICLGVISDAIFNEELEYGE